MEIMFNAVYDEYCSSSMCSAIGVLSVIDCVVWDFKIGWYVWNSVCFSISVFMIVLYLSVDFG